MDERVFQAGTPLTLVLPNHRRPAFLLNYAQIRSMVGRKIFRPGGSHMKRILFASVLLVLVLSPSVMAQAKKPISKEGLVNAAKALFEAVKANDVDKIKTYYGADYTFTGPDGKTVNGEERLRVMKAQGAGNFMGAADLETRLYGDAAIVTGVATTKSPTGATEQSRFIQVWIMQGENLRLVATQVTRIE